LLAIEVTPHDHASAPLQQRDRLGRDSPRGDVGVLDNRPRALALLQLAGNLVDLGTDALGDHREDLVDRPPRGEQSLANRGLDLCGRARRVVGRRLP
jgi:hypothetical protein